MCYAKFGAAKCNIWLLACEVKDRFGVITADQKECIKKQNDMPDVFLLCKKKYGVEFCTKLKSACFKILKVNVITNVAGNVEVLPHSISICIQS
ncbi:unnamed protein product, partial [Anisakis simplex]|uniref:Uncharacterized protein n=1 Tax=Anisakis simplex TaxID=6269 RepID=A0A0M3JP54_ANISI